MQTPMAKPTRDTDAFSSVSSNSSISCPHQFVKQHQAEAIERWSSQVPSKASWKDFMNAPDPSIQAYIEAKLALLQHGTLTK